MRRETGGPKFLSRHGKTFGEVAQVVVGSVSEDRRGQVPLVEGVQPREFVALHCDVERLFQRRANDADLECPSSIDYATRLDDRLVVGGGGGW